MKTHVYKNFNLVISFQCIFTRKYALHEMEGSLIQYYGKLWSYVEDIKRDFFLRDIRCDDIDNDILENFNVANMDVMKKPIISMLEEIRIFFIDRLYHQHMSFNRKNYVRSKD